MEHARPPAELCLEGGPAARSEAWRKWRKLFEVFLKASGVSKKPKEVQASLLVNLIGSAGYEVYTTFTFKEGENEDDIDCILKKFDGHFGAKPNITVRRFKFFTRNQEEGENIDQYLTALRLLSQQCEFGELQESLLRDKIVCGIINNTVRDRLLRTDDLTLQKVKAIMDMPYPCDRKALERFLGMVNYLAKFIHGYSECVNSLRTLLKKESAWIWEQQHSDAVDKLKGKLATAPVLALYCERTPIVLSVDASSVALGAVLLQAGRPVEFASLTLTDAQTRYAQIEKEMLAIVFAVERFRQYIYGRSDVTIHSDHKPLEALFSKPLVSVPARLQRMMMRVQGYEFKVIYTPGKYMYIADTLSRAPLKELMQDGVSAEVETQTCFMLQNVPFSPQKLEKIQNEIKKDSECTWLLNYVLNGWPRNRRDVIEKIKVFWPYREQLHYVAGIIFKGDRVFIPSALRAEMLSRVHEGHLGIERCKRRAREVMFWPGLCEDVERTVRRCTACALHAPSARRQPLLQHTVPALPWHKLASDTFEYKKKNYVVLVDYFSNYVEVGQVVNVTSSNIIKFMKEQFSRHGIPAELVTDNGPAYSSQEFKKFMRDWEVTHETSSPSYPQSNGKSERTVQTVKNLLKKCVDSGEDFYLSLLNFRATPRNGLDSPAQMLMGRRLNTKLPVSAKLLGEKVNNEQNYQALLNNRLTIKKYYDRSAMPLKRLSLGDKATMINNGTRKPVSVVARATQPRSYIVEDESGNRYRRTRSHLVVRGPGAPEKKKYMGDKKTQKQVKTPVVPRRRTKSLDTTGSSPQASRVVPSASPALEGEVEDLNSSFHSIADDYSPNNTTDSSSCLSSPSPKLIPVTRSKARLGQISRDD